MFDMGLFQSLKNLSRWSAPNEVLTPIRSPWSSSDLVKVVIADLEGVERLDMSRSVAMMVPSVARGRGLICGLLSRHPLTLTDENGPTGPAGWMVSTQTAQSPRMRMLWTFDDLIFSGVSVWAVDRDGDDEVIDGLRIPPDKWTLTDGELVVDGRKPRPDEVCIFEGPQEGLVVIAERTIRAALDIEKAWANRVKVPVPLVALHGTDANFELTPEEAADLVAKW
ncbi:MAG: hypothetical protein LBK28_06375, partial [Propionibacteriaceae bacterium]|nr:hypothetical protein [Propionibacteriaceae bacterium]